MSALVRATDREAVHYLPPGPAASIICGRAIVVRPGRYTREPADVTCRDCYAHPAFPKERAPAVGGRS
jgi:hypothetical protein